MKVINKLKAATATLLASCTLSYSEMQIIEDSSADNLLNFNRNQIELETEESERPSATYRSWRRNEVFPWLSIANDQESESTSLGFRTPDNIFVLGQQTSFKGMFYDDTNNTSWGTIIQIKDNNGLDKVVLDYEKSNDSELSMAYLSHVIGSFDNQRFIRTLAGVSDNNSDDMYATGILGRYDKLLLGYNFRNFMGEERKKQSIVLGYGTDEWGFSDNISGRAFCIESESKGRAPSTLSADLELRFLASNLGWRTPTTVHQDLFHDSLGDLNGIDGLDRYFDSPKRIYQPHEGGIIVLKATYLGLDTLHSNDYEHKKNTQELYLTYPQTIGPFISPHIGLKRIDEEKDEGKDINYGIEIGTDGFNIKKNRIRLMTKLNYSTEDHGIDVMLRYDF